MHWLRSFALFLALFLGCTHAVVQQSSEILLNESVSLNSPETLNRSDAQRDLEFLRQAFAKGYVGFRVQAPQVKERFETDLDQITLGLGPQIPTKEFCSQVAAALAKIPDNHLEIYSNKQFCGPAPSESLTSVNVAYAKGSKRFWIITGVQAKRKNIPVVAILRFPDPEDSGWDRFKMAFLQAMKAPAIIFDLRGNSGGHIGMAQWMAQMLGESVLSRARINATWLDFGAEECCSLYFLSRRAAASKTSTSRCGLAQGFPVRSNSGR